MKTIDRVNAKRIELGDLHKRMDADIGILTLPFILKGFVEHLKDKKIPNSISVTLNKANVFADYYSATLAAMTRQAVVTGLSSDTANHEVEEFAADLLFSIDEQQRLQNKGTSGIWFADNVVKRGPIGYRLMFDKDGRCLTNPLDMRWATWQENGRGYDWKSYRTLRDGESLRKEYGKHEKIKLLFNPDGKDLKVEDWWDNEKRELWVDEKLLFEQKNTLGFIPILFEFPLVGTFIEDTGYLKYRYESALFLNRLIYDEWNRLASILQTMGVSVLYPAIEKTVADGEALVGGQYPVPATVTPVRTGESIKAIFTPEITNAFMTALQNLAQALKDGGVSDAEMGETSPDVTGIRFTQLWAQRNRRMKPRSDAISQMYAGLVKLAIREIRALNIKPKLGQGKKDYSKLPDPDEFNISYRLMPDDAVMNTVRLLQGKGMDGFLSKYDIYKDILHHEDPDGALTNLYLEQAIMADPVTRYRELSRRARVKAKTLYGAEKKDMVADALHWADMMEREMAISKQNVAPSPLKPPTGQAKALETAGGIMRSGA